MKIKRPPIIAIVGHVDHGKTTLLDYIRKTNVVAGEAGGITQATRAYAVIHNGHPLTFIDTPGHKAFGAMRARGARVADLAVLAVSAIDGVAEQTKEALLILEETKTPFVVAITKTDMNVPLDKVKNELAQAGVLLEGQGGHVSWHGISAKTGDGINDLLDIVALTADLANLTYDPALPARGYCIEATKDARNGVMVFVVALDGVLRVGADVAIGEVTARVKGLIDSTGARVTECPAGLPVAIVGFKELPLVGCEIRELAKGETVAPSPRAVPAPTRRSSAKDRGIVINAMVKADAQGPLEALVASVKAIAVPEGCAIRIASQGVGDITDGDVQWFTASDTQRGIVLGFNVATTKQADYVAKANRITIITSRVIYDLVDAVTAFVLKATGGAIVGDMEVLALFGNKDDKNHVVGGRVVVGEIKTGSACVIMRAASEVGAGTIENMQSGKKEVGRVALGNECGLLVRSSADIRVGDHIVIR